MKPSSPRLKLCVKDNLSIEKNQAFFTWTAVKSLRHKGHFPAYATHRTAREEEKLQNTPNTQKSTTRSTASVGRVHGKHGPHGKRAACGDKPQNTQNTQKKHCMLGRNHKIRKRLKKRCAQNDVATPQWRISFATLTKVASSQWALCAEKCVWRGGHRGEW